MKRFVLYLVVLSVLIGVWQAEIALAIAPGQSDDFQDGTTQNWTSGGPNPNPPVNIPDGGPGGVGDNFLQIQSTGGGGSGSKLVAFNTTQWTGDYTAAGVTVISAHLNNLGDTDLVLRLQLSGPGGDFVSTNGIPLPAGSGWTVAVFPVAAGDLTGTGDVNATLSNVTKLWLFHNPNATTARLAPAIVATLGVDNFTAADAPGGKGSIDGHVREVTGKPLWSLVIAINAETKEKEITLSNANDDGYYKISDLPPGDYWVICIKKGYKAGIAKVVVVPGVTITQDFELVPK